MSVERTAIEEQTLGGVAMIMNAVAQGSHNIFKEISGYQNKTIPYVFMLIQKIKISNKLSGPYYTIGFQSPNTRYVVDGIDVFFQGPGVYLRGQGFQLEIANTKTNVRVQSSIMESWIKMLIASNDDITEMLKANEEFIHGRKKPGK